MVKNSYNTSYPIKHPSLEEQYRRAISSLTLRQKADVEAEVYNNSEGCKKMDTARALFSELKRQKTKENREK